MRRQLRQDARAVDRRPDTLVRTTANRNSIETGAIDRSQRRCPLQLAAEEQTLNADKVDSQCPGGRAWLRTMIANRSKFAMRLRLVTSVREHGTLAVCRLSRCAPGAGSQIFCRLSGGHAQWVQITSPATAFGAKVHAATDADRTEPAPRDGTSPMSPRATAPTRRARPPHLCACGTRLPHKCRSE